jgi:hypothetical protein
MKENRGGAEIAGLFGIVGVIGILFAPIAGKIADRRGPHTVIGLGSNHGGSIGLSVCRDIESGETK